MQLLQNCYGSWCYYYIIFFRKKTVDVIITTKKMVDSRVRDQLSPSPVDHEKITVRFNEWTRFVRNKNENICTFPHTILSRLFSVMFDYPTFQW